MTETHPWAAGLGTLRAQVWAELGRGVEHPQAPARYLTLATVSPVGWPEARTVVLRAAEAVAGVLDIYTDIASGKIASLRANPRAALHVWDRVLRLQSRLDVTVTILTGNAVAQLWDGVPAPSRQSYGTRPAPGSEIPGSLSYEKSSDIAAFAVLRCAVQGLDVVHLGPRHRRARFDRANGWVGQWLSP